MIVTKTIKLERGETMDINYVNIDRVWALEEEKQITDIHQKIFQTKECLSEKIKKKPSLVTNLAIHNDRIVGYKIGYELDCETFYSWLGGVDPHFRKQGIATKLMEEQHAYARKLGYRKVQTKTMNRWRSMLLLNIKSGFDVIQTIIDENGIHKIVLEKEL